jgi:hypothetical protein
MNLRSLAPLGVVLALGLSSLACSTTKFAGQVVSCADQKPVPEAKLAYKSTDTTNNNLAGSMPKATDKNGKFEASLALAQGAGIKVTVEKDGYEPKEETMSGGAEQQICIAPKK